MNAALLSEGSEGPATAHARWWRWRPVMGVETALLLCSVYFTLASNGPFWRAAIADPAAQWRFVLSLFLVLTALHALLMGLLMARLTLKPLMAVLIVVTALASHYMATYGVYLDQDIVSSVIHTERKESAELITSALLVPLLASVVPLVLLWRVQLRRRRWGRALVVRLAFLLAMLLVTAAGALLSGQELSSLLRNQREVRYLATPGNYLVALAQILVAAPPGVRPELVPIGLDAKQVPPLAGRKPRLLVLVVGETVRAQNWGLNGYTRQTTPELARIRGLVNYPDVDACGTNTEVSLPCLFSPQGRAAYDQDLIRSQQSLLHVLDRAGIATLWRDNQTGCKRVCDGLPLQRLDDATVEGLCDPDGCLDEVLLHRFTEQLDPASSDRVVVLHQLGNHGPSYFSRYPAAFAKFQPACESPDLGRCEREQIINAYDNSLLYTDYFLARTIELLGEENRYDTAMIYLSDHGESLGEKGLYLHGMPYSIAPSEQTRVPMVMWFSPGFTASAGLDLACLQRQSLRPASHDNLFPSVLGLMQVRTALYRREGDLFAACRTAAAG